jgi:hypothetical protein
MRLFLLIKYLLILMLVKQITYLILFIYWVLAYTYLYITPSILISNKYLIRLVKTLSQ